MLGCIFVVHLSEAKGPSSVTIEYLAHASFIIHAPDGKRLLIDPYADRVWIGYDFPKAVSADVVLISHPHFDHDGGEYRSGRSAWAGKVPVLRWPGRWELSEDTTVYGIQGHHAGSYGREFGQINTVWRIEMAGLNIVHWGDSTDFRAGLPPAVLTTDHLGVQRRIDPSPGTHPAVGRFDRDPVAGCDLARRRRRRMQVNLRIERPAPQAR